MLFVPEWLLIQTRCAGSRLCIFCATVNPSFESTLCCWFNDGLLITKHSMSF